MSLMFMSILALSGCMAITVIGGVISGVDSVAKELKIKKLETKINEMKDNREKSSDKTSTVYVPSYHDMNLMTQHNMDLLDKKS